MERNPSIPAGKACRKTAFLNEKRLSRAGERESLARGNYPLKLRRFADGRRRMEFSVLIGGEEGADSVDNGPELFFAQFGEHRQRQDFTADPMGHRQILRRVAEILEAFLLVEAERVEG